MANHFSQLAKKSRTNGSSEKIAKEQTGKPSLDIYKLGDDVLRQNSKRITKVDESIRKLARDCLLYTSDAADDSLRVDLGGRRIIKKKYKESKLKC